MQIDSEQIYQILTNTWYPEPSYNFIATGKRNLKFQYKWLDRWKWLAYSKSDNGVYCKYCISFGPEEVCSQKLGKFVVTKFDDWPHAINKFNEHQKNNYHLTAVSKVDGFLSVFNKKQNNIAVQLDNNLKIEIEQNRLILHPIIETIILCGRQGLALRGHKDSGHFQPGELYSTENDGNFRAFLRYRVSGGDLILKNHLQNCKKNAMYTSPEFQNEIIDTIYHIIINKLVCKINQSKCYTVLADETCDISGVEQFSLCVRYFDKATKTLREDFLKFVPVVDVSGKSLAKVLLDTLKSIGINLDFLRGQGYDGASAMQGKFNGVQAIVKESYPLALYLHCSSHSLNLCISDACNLKPIRNATGTLQAVCVFLRTPKRQDVLEKAIDKCITDTRKKKLKKLCPTRWVERHEAVLVFLELYDAIVEALENISSWNDRDTSSQASNLLCSIKQGEFLLCIFILVNVFSVSLPLSKKLQDEHLDLTEAIELAENVKEVTTQRRAEAEKQFKNIYDDVLKKSEKFDINIKVPRLANKQEHRTNVITDSAESYYRVSLYIPFLDSFNQQLNDRFLAHKSILSNFLCLVNDKENSDECFKVLLKTYKVDIEADVHSALGEFALWKQQIKSKPITNVVSALAECNENIYPSIYTLLNILASLPVTTATSERSFSTLRRLKTYLRNTITENRLNGLALMNIHRDVKVTVEEVIENMARKSRRIRLL